MELEDLYQELIIDHGTHPQNFHDMPDATHRATGINPLCGDKVLLYLKIENDIITQVSFQGQGCAISTASASIMTEILINKTLAEAQLLFTQFKDLITTDSDDSTNTKLGKLNALAGVKAFPSRVKCATLAWHTLLSALNNNNITVTTEIPGED